MKPLKHIEIGHELIQKIIAFFPSKTFKAQSHLFYEGQVPISGYLILNGTVQISQKRKFKKMLQAGQLIGVSELLNKKPSTISAEVFPNTEVCFLDRTTLLEIFKNGDSDLTAFFQSLFEKTI